MRRFEYKQETVDKFSVKELNEYGNEGWELVTILPVPNSSIIILYFKRELEPAPVGRDVTIDEVLHDIDTGRYEASARIRYALHQAGREKKTYLREVEIPCRNFGKKTRTEWQKLNTHYLGK